jgi:Ca2+-binding EF-hand superfamily protein
MAVKAMQQDGKKEITRVSLQKFLEDHKFYLSKQEIDTLISVIVGEGNERIEDLTPEQVMAAIEQSREHF